MSRLALLAAGGGAAGTKSPPTTPAGKMDDGKMGTAPTGKM